MRKKRDDKIFNEIREKVLHKDLERQNEQEIKEMREANIEALTELTSLSRKEVEEIADQVKSSYLIKEKIRQKRIIQFSILGVIALVILYFIFRPAPELKTRIVEDDFSSNSFEWSIINSFTYSRYFRDGQYMVETNNSGWCYWDEMKVNFPANCDIEVASKWVNGKFDSYGVGLIQSNSEYYAFTIKGDGSASFGKVLDGKWVIDDASKNNMGNSGKNQPNIQRIEIRNKNFNYYVNNNLVRTGILDMNYSGVSLYHCGEQLVAFDYIKVTNADTKKIEFFDNFDNPSNLWNPKKNFKCESNFLNGKYVFNANNEGNCHWSTSSVHNITDNCEIELTSTWLTGDLSSYGPMILQNDDDYYSCELQNNGVARLVECRDDKYTYIQDDLKTNFESSGKNAIKQKVIIKGNELSYYVENKLIKKMKTKLEFPCQLSLRICGKQSIAFDHLKIKYFE